ncbi:unnamed protein product [Didymodactylos carnosus]|uniref:MULE transposase domain-containing protein n=1 Tax=Didymodactylos carnosus TaxID=1234261 RepID=A0A813NQB7_9BILA|nr:unnamed protein product [Didymodactylos carnosus]CAF3521572.1 unnamed protein product [Didymodactylos carnosus]
MIFGSEWSIRFLSSCSFWHSDGTFKVRPLFFEQLYIVFGFQNGFMIPCTYSLTTRKNSVVYTKILRHLIEYGKKLNVEMNPQRLTCDFEQATINSFVDIFPHIKINGCFFHYAQSLWRKIQEVGMMRHFEKTNDNKTVIPKSERKKADHIYEFVRLLRDEHSFQHHQTAASEIRAPKRKKLYIDIDNKLKELLHGFATGIVNEVELVIKCDRAAKTT